MRKMSKHIGGKTICTLCPHFCFLEEGEKGICGTRICKNEQIISVAYGRISSMAVEPIEKKPITHFLQGSKTLSIGSKGCSLRCRICENSIISQDYNMEDIPVVPVKDIINTAIQYNCQSICMTYNEPTISYEFLLDLAEESHKNDLFFVIKTNAYVNKDPWEDICSVTDAMNIDWKGGVISYQEMCGVKRCSIENRIQEAYNKNVHIEISIPVHKIMFDTELNDVKEFGEFLFKLYPLMPCHLLKVYASGSYSYTTSDREINVVRDILSSYLHIVAIH